MNVHAPRQSAIDAMDAYLAGAHQADSLHVSPSGKVSVRAPIITLFNRAANRIRQHFDKGYTPNDGRARAREAVLNSLAREVSLFSDSVSSADMKALDTLLTRISAAPQAKDRYARRARFSDEIVALRTSHANPGLVAALEKIHFFAQSGNAALFPYVRPHLQAHTTLPQALEKGLNSYLTKALGLPQANANNACKILSKVMLSYGINVHEAIDIFGCISRVRSDAQVKAQRLPALPLSYLCVHHGLQLPQAIDLYLALHAAGKTVANSRQVLQLMQSHQLPLSKADAIVTLAASMATERTSQPLSPAQRIEIAWLQLHQDKSATEATLISLVAGRIEGDIPVARPQRLAQAEQHIEKRFNEIIAPTLPAGWPDHWEALADGSRRLAGKPEFTAYCMTFLRDSIASTKIDEHSGLAHKFIEDAGRTHFRFGTGRDAVNVPLNKERAISELQTFIPDGMARQSLSRALFQGGCNALVAAMTETLGQEKQTYFSILSLDETNEKQKAHALPSISLQRTDDGKLRVGYTVHMKHFSLHDTVNERKIRINDRFNSSTTATPADHTGIATLVVEFDPDQLQRGVIEPTQVREAELRLTIEPDRERLLQQMLDSL